MLKVGITGTIASGKTVVCQMIKDLGYKTISADDIVRELQKPQGLLWNEINRLWPEKFIDKNGDLDAKQMRDMIIVDPEFKKKIEEITHPLIKSKVLEYMKHYSLKGEPALFIEVPLLFEAGWQDIFDNTIVTYAGENTLISRMAERGIDESTAKKWIDIQESQDSKIKKSDYKIDTDETIEEVKGKVNNIVIRIIQEVKNDNI